MMNQKIKKIALFAGTRPEVIKLASLLVELKKLPHLFQTLFFTTGQHRELLEQMLVSLNLDVEENFDVMTPGQSLCSVSARILLRCDELFQRYRPDLVITQGDTATAFCVSLAAYYHQIAIGHVEAGLRTGNKYNPFPEEGMRHLLDGIADFYWAPTQQAVDNLKKEGVPENTVYITGNTVIDSLLMVVDQKFKKDPASFQMIDFSKKIILMTLHRRENWGVKVQQVLEACCELVKKHQDIEIIYPVHFTPAVREKAYEMLGKISRINLLEPLDYVSFVSVLSKAYLVLTDSGGVQEEAPALGKPVLVLRETTERPEGVTAGTAKLIGLNKEDIIAETGRLLTDNDEYERMAKAVNPYGDGEAARRIVQSMRYHYFNDCPKPDDFTPRT